MSAVTMPSSPLPQSVVPQPVTAGGWQQPIAGGVTTRLDRLGDRWSATISMPRLKMEPDGRIWTARLTTAIGNLVIFTWPQPGLDVGVPGTPVADGVQSGSSVKIKGMTPGYVVREGQFLNTIDGVTTFLHRATADAVVGGDGKVTVPVWPMLRATPGAAISDGSYIGIAALLIVGILKGDPAKWTLARAGTSGVQFVIEEER